MSLFGSLMGDIEDDPFFGSHMNMMRQMNTMMNSFFDPFAMTGFGDFDRGHHHHRMHHNSLMPFSMPVMPNFNRLLSGSLDSLGQHQHHQLQPHHSSSYSSTVVSMSSGPDGRPQVYKATSSTRTGPGGIKETQKTVSDSISGTKKMAIGHHIGERAHIIEKEQNMHTGDREERQDFINLDEDEAEDFNREWETKARSSRSSEIPRISSVSSRNRHSYGGSGHPGLLAITGAPRRSRQSRQNTTTPIVSQRRSIRSSPFTTPMSSAASSSRTPYSPPGPAPRKSKNVKTVSGSPPPPADM